MRPEGEEHPEGIDMETDLNNALAEILKKHKNAFVLKWFAIVEVMDENERGLYTFVSPDAKRWDIMGLLEHLRTFQTAHAMVEIMEDHHGFDG